MFFKIIYEPLQQISTHFTQSIKTNMFENIIVVNIMYYVIMMCLLYFA